MLPGQKALELDKQPDDLSIDEDDEDEDESFGERIWGLTEMFPETLRSVCGVVSELTVAGVKISVSLGRSALWIAASSAAIMVLPIVFETERAQHHEQQLQQERQILLGPNAAVSGGQGQNLMPGIMPPGMAMPGGSK